MTPQTMEPVKSQDFPDNIKAELEILRGTVIEQGPIQQAPPKPVLRPQVKDDSEIPALVL